MFFYVSLPGQGPRSLPGRGTTAVAAHQGTDNYFLASGDTRNMIGKQPKNLAQNGCISGTYLGPICMVVRAHTTNSLESLRTTSHRHQEQIPFNTRSANTGHDDALDIRPFQPACRSYFESLYADNAEEALMFTATRPEARSQTDLANRVSMFTDPGGQPEAQSRSRDITDSVRVLCHLWPSMNFFYYTQPSWVLLLQLLETFMYQVPVFMVYLARKISS